MKTRLLTNNTYWDWALFFSILLYQIVPSVYNSYNIYLIGNAIPSENSLAIVSQWQFIQVIVEIIQESLVFPIFYFIGSQLKGGNMKILSSRIAIIFRLLLIILLPITVILFFQIDLFVNIIDTPEEIIYATKSYLEIRIGALTISIINIGLIIIVESLNKKKLLLKILLLKMIFFLVFDSLFFGGYSFSMDLGIRGVALSNLIVEVLILIFVSICITRITKTNILRGFNSKFEFADLKLFGRISIGIGIESAIKNIAYLTMIITIINTLGTKPIGGYYLSMHFFWSFLLVPILSLADTLKVLIANNFNNIHAIKNLLKFGFFTTLLLFFCWLLLIPVLDPIFKYFNKDIEIVNYAKIAFYILFLPYCLLSLNLILNSVFYGLGDTKYLAYKSIITNLSVYLVAYVCYKTQLWTPTFSSVLILFSIGIVVGTVLTCYFVDKILKDRSRVVL